MNGNMEVQRLQRLAESRVRAEACAEGFVERGRMCGGCAMSGLCKIGRKFDQAYPNNGLLRVLADPVVQRNVTMVELKPMGVK